MATTDKTIFSAETGYQRDEASVGINQASVIRAQALLTYIEKYHPKEHALFLAGLGNIPQSFENEQYVDTLLRFAEAFLQNHPEDQERLQSISPREMVEEVSQQLVEDAKTRRADIRRRASEIVKKYARGTTAEKRELENKLVASINASVNKAETPQQLRTAIEEEIAKMPLPTKEVVQELVDTDPLSAQHLLLTNPARDVVISEHITTLPAPAWHGYVAAIKNLQMKPDETIKLFINRAKEIGQTTAFLSADLSQTPEARIEPSGLISAILEAGGNKDALRAFGKLTEQAKNMVSLAVVSKSWNAAVEVITQRAGGTVTGALEEIIKQGNAQWGAHSGEPLGKAGSAVAGILGEILTPAFINYADAQTLGGQGGNRVAAFIKSLPAAQHDEAATTALFLAITTTWRPNDVRFEWQQEQNGGGLGAWAIHFAKDSVLEKLFSKFLKSKAVGVAGGTATRVAGEGVKRGVAAVLTKLGLSAFAGVFTGGTSLLAQAAFLVGGKVFGGLWRAGSWFFSAGWVSSLLGLGGQQEQRHGPDWTTIGIAGVIGVAVIVPMFGAMLQITTRDSALFVASFPSNTGGPYIESFPPYNGPFPEESPPLASCPVSSAPITQKPFSNFSHEGVCAYDFGSQKGAAIYATHDGCVAGVRSDVPNDKFIEGEFGNYVRLAGTGPTGHYYTAYAHLMQGTTLSAGQCIKAGTIIGRVDTTGFTFDSSGHRGGGTHLHYQYNDGQKTCPSLPTGCGY